MTTVIYIGNMSAPTATEAAYRDGFEAAGCKVIGLDQADAFRTGPAWFEGFAETTHPDLVVYSRTHNNTALGPEWTNVWRTLEERGVKTASVHLDVFWGLAERERWIEQGDPLFTTGLVMTADGGSDEKWTAAGVNHRWLPPGCDARFIPERAEPIPELAGKIVFVGSAYGYHPLWSHRAQMIDFATKTWPDRFVIYGNGSPNGPVRDPDLSRVYASDCIVIGDCCFADQRRAYVSDRLPESLGRGALLCMATNDGLGDWWDEQTDYLRWPAGDFDELARTVNWCDEEASPRDLQSIRADGRSITLEHSTYRHRARTVLAACGIEVEA